MTISPVAIQPSLSTSAVASGRCQYPRMTCSPLTQSSPASPSCASEPSSLIILISVFGTGTPIVPLCFTTLIGQAAISGEHSVMP